MKNKLLYSLTLFVALGVVGCDNSQENSTSSIENSISSIENSSISSESSLDISSIAPAGPYDHFGRDDWTPSVEGSIVGKYATIPGVPTSKTINGLKYTYAWAEEFDGTELNSDYWNIEVNGNGGGNGEWQFYTPQNLTVRDGKLEIHGKKEEYGGKQYTSGRINSKGRVKFKYGYVEAIISVPSFKGSWPAFWMMGENYGWPKCGEIDIMEAINMTSNVQSTLHYGENNAGHKQPVIGKYDFGSSSARNGYHHYEMIWNEEEIITYVDNYLIGRISINDSIRSKYFHQEFRFILNLAIGGSWPGDPNGSHFATDQVMYVDYVRVYQPFTYEL